MGADPFRIFALIGPLFHGKARLKAKIASETAINVADLPYDPRVLKLVEQAHRDGRQVYLASASNEQYVSAVAAHIGADGWFGSSADENLSGRTKAARLVSAFGRGEFDYIGDSRADLPIWQASRKRYAVDPPKSLRRQLNSTVKDVEIIAPSGNAVWAWVKLARVQQWAKNALVFVPTLTAQKFDAPSLIHASGAFVAFSLAASSVYIVNDLVDLEEDRRHPTKRRRPLAAGTVPILSAIPGSAPALKRRFCCRL